MVPKKIRIILDTNWYVSAAINKNSRRTLYDLLTHERLTVLYSEELIAEFFEVMSRKKFKKMISSIQVSRFAGLVISKMEPILLKTVVTGSRDPNDNFLLSLSLDGRADFLVTGDLDLLVLQKTGTTQIMRLNDFLSVLEVTLNSAD